MPLKTTKFFWQLISMFSACGESYIKYASFVDRVTLALMLHSKLKWLKFLCSNHDKGIIVHKSPEWFHAKTFPICVTYTKTTLMEINCPLVFAHSCEDLPANLVLLPVVSVLLLNILMGLSLSFKVLQTCIAYCNVSTAVFDIILRGNNWCTLN